MHFLPFAFPGFEVTEVLLAGLSMVPEAQKHLLPNHPSWVGACLRAMTLLAGLTPRCGCKRMSFIVAQTMGSILDTAREGVDLIGALSHIALRDFRSHWWSECVDASAEETQKT